jgi:DNA-directed RNA polymerase subunit RPC12/RpoP
MPTPVIPCPRCKKPLTLNQMSGKILCRNCDFVPTDRTAYKITMIAHLSSDDPLHPDRLRGTRVSRPGLVSGRALAAYETGEQHVKKGEFDKALEAFQRALDAQPDLIDAHLQMARLMDDVDAKVRHINTVLEYVPKQEDAFRMAMVLMGEMTEDESARTFHHNDQQVKQVDEVSAQVQTQKCAVCGGRMSVEERTGKLKCPFCGYEEPIPVKKPTGDLSQGKGLTMALVKRKAQPIKWVIGKRLLHCNECGAERTIPARKLTAQCPFCGSPQVIVQDALSSFTQPERIVPFAITREQAGGALKAALKGAMERLKGMFDNRKVERALIDGVYLPFWLFDAAVEVIGRRSDNGGRASFPDWVEDVPYCAVETPPQEMTSKLGGFDMKAMLPYEPRLLADYPAQLYSIDYDRASLDARSLISKVSKDKYDLLEIATKYDAEGHEQLVEVYLRDKQVNFLDMSFQLVLLPVWVATLYEQDGDVRTALINGQNGQVVMGKAKKE